VKTEKYGISLDPKGPNHTQNLRIQFLPHTEHMASPSSQPINWLMLFREIITAYSKSVKKITTLRGQNAVF
jgi:hypothetical protein